MYFKALTDGLVNFPIIPMKFRNKIRLLHRKVGTKNFYSRLIKLDPMIKSRINPSDTQRAMRAYEIKLFTNKSMYEWFDNTKSNYKKQDFYKIYLDFPRNDLIKRILKRAEIMIQNGGISEVKRFLKLRLPKNKSANKAIGISEVKDYLSKKINIETVIDKISIKTRQYAKRQATWGRGHMKDWNKINPKGLKDFLKKI